MKYQIVKLNTARNSLRAVVKAFNIKEIYIPYYICPVVRSVLIKENCKINFYLNRLINGKGEINEKN